MINLSWVKLKLEVEFSMFNRPEKEFAFVFDVACTFVIFVLFFYIFVSETIWVFFTLSSFSDRT